MLGLDFSFPCPSDNLAYDESLLEDCDKEGIERIRFWEPAEVFVVVGYANAVEKEVKTNTCRRDGVPVLRRCTGGGTIVQAPGVLNFALVLSSARRPETLTIPGTNKFVMERHAAALSKFLGDEVTVEGDTDLAIGGVKFSGNAQRRRRESLLFHGTILWGMDLDLIPRYLSMPTRMPAYRQKREHEAFVRNVAADGDAFRRVLTEVWGASEQERVIPILDPALSARYADEAWNWKF